MPSPLLWSTFLHACIISHIPCGPNNQFNCSFMFVLIGYSTIMVNFSFIILSPSSWCFHLLFHCCQFWTCYYCVSPSWKLIDRWKGCCQSFKLKCLFVFGLTIFLTNITFTSSLYVTWLQIKLIILGLQKQIIAIVAWQDNIHLHGSW